MEIIRYTLPVVEGCGQANNDFSEDSIRSDAVAG